MSLFNILDLNEQNKRESHIKNLLEMAIADGNLDNEEFELVTFIASKFNMTIEEVEAIRQKPGDISFTPPSSFKAKALQLYDLVQIMLADREIHEKELKLCHQLATKLRLDTGLVDIMIEVLSENVSGRNADQKILEVLENYERSDT
jgi:uncharacterized tellurite resistance protein B-like protein